MADDEQVNPETPDLPTPIDLPDQGYVYIRDAEGLAECITELSKCSVIGVDTESDSFFSYREQCCLIQATGDGTIDYIIDPLILDDISAFGPLMADPAIVKIFHGADYDVVSMKRDFGFEFRNIFDTMIAAQASGHDRFGLNDLVKRYFGRSLDKKWQRHDWSTRPLQDAQMDYARLDSHFLPTLREILLEQCASAGRVPMLEEEFTLLESRDWNGREFDPDSCMKLKGANSLDDEQRRVLRQVVALRESIAESKNRPPFKVWGNDICLKLAEHKPTSGSAMRKVLGEKNHVARRYLKECLAAVQAGLEDERPPPEPPAPVSRFNKNIPPFTRDDEPLLSALKRWRNKLCDSLGLGPGMVLNNALLKEFAALKPKEAAQFDLLPDMRKWQRDAFGDDVLSFVSEWLEKHPPSDDSKGDRPARRRRRRRGGRGRGKPAEGAETPSAGPSQDAS